MMTELKRPPLRPLRILVVAALIAGCAVQPPRSEENLDSVSTSATERLSTRVAAESAKLADTVDTLRSDLETRNAPPSVTPRTPSFDPLEAQTITLNLVRAHITDAVRAITADASINLIIDPAVNELSQRATLSLDGVSVREAIDNILAIYDVHGVRSGRTLRLSLREERVYSLDFLNTASSLKNADGGDLFGSDASGLSSSQTLTTEGGSEDKPYDLVAANARRLVGVEEEREEAVLSRAEAQRLAEGRTRGASGLEGDGARAAARRMATAPGTSPRLSASASGSDEEETREQVATVSLDSLSGTLFVRARPSRIRAVDRYMERLRRALGRQVFIEAQLIDVRLRDSFRFGIDWTVLRDNFAGVLTGSAVQLGQAAATLPNGGGALPAQGLTIPARNLTAGNGKSLGVAYRDSNFGAVLQALDRFGNVSVLSNPNLLARNGTPAMLSVGTTSRFVSSSSSSQTAPGGGASTTTVDVETDSVFSGVTVGVVPFIRDDGSVELLVHPVQTDVDPASLALVNVGGETRITLPQVSLKGLTTTLRLNDGDLVLIGGLIDQSRSENDESVPGVASLPLVGRLFGTREEISETRELVVAIRVRVL